MSASNPSLASSLQSNQITSQFPPRYHKVIFDLLLVYFLMALVISINLIAMDGGLSLWIRIPLAAISGILNAIFFHSLFLFLHEAGHFNFLPGKKSNDFWANALVGYWFFQDVRIYRKMHWDHHLNHGETDDPENSYFHPLTFSNLARALFGLFALSKILHWDTIGKSLGDEAQERWARRKAKAFFIFYNLILGGLFFYFQAYWEFFVVWLIPAALGFPFFAFIRQVCEHRKPGAGLQNFEHRPHGPFTRVFKKSLTSYFLGGCGFRQHWYHHFNPYISYTQLDDFSRQVKSAFSEETREVLEESYFQVFLNLLRDTRKARSGL